MSDKIKLYEIRDWFDCHGNHYRAWSLYMAFAFKEWKKEYNNNRPVEPYCTSENPEQWADIAFYAEDKLKEAFEAGYQSCCEE